MYQQRSYDELITIVKPQWEQDKTDGEALYWIICCLHDTDKKSEAIKFGNVGIKLIANLTWKGRIYNRVGSFYWRMGKLDIAESYYNNSLNIMTESGQDIDRARVKNNLGILFDIRGKLDEALFLYNEALDLNTKGNAEGLIGSNLVNIGIIFFTKNKTSEAIEKFLKALEIFKKNELNSGIVVVSHQLLLSYMRLGDDELANKMYYQIETIATSRDSTFIQSIYLISKAIRHKSSSRLKDRVSAMKIFEQIINNTDYEYEQIIIAMIHLTGLKLDEYRLLSNISVLTEIKDLIDQIHDNAEQNSTYPLVIETKLLQVKLLSINSEFDEAYTVLNSARDFIVKYSLLHLEEKLKKEEIELQKMITPIKELVDSNKEIISKMEVESIKDYLLTLKSIFE